MRQINFAINISEDNSPLNKYSGVYPSEAFQSPQVLAQSIVDFLNEEFDLHLVVKIDRKKIIGELVP